jgi:hypothetical protein
VIVTALLALVSVIPLPLPQYVTVPVVPVPDQVERNPFSTGANVIAASAADASGNGRAWVAVWKDGQRVALPPAPPGGGAQAQPFLQLGAVAPGGDLFVERGEPYSGVSMGVDYAIYALQRGAWTGVSTDSCGSNGIAHLFGVEADGTLDVTFETQDLVNFDSALAGDAAPSAARISHGTCTQLGRFDLRDANSTYAVGFRGYYANGHLAATNLDRDAQHDVAVRFHAGSVVELGPGAALAVASDGTAAGRGAAHATVWDATGSATDLTPQAKASTAYAIDAAHRVIGSLTAPDGRHYAFVWQNGHLYRLDDLLHAAGWRFEAAFRFAQGGAIAGVGTHDGIATAFCVRDLTLP